MKKVLIVSSIFPPEIGGPASYIPEVITRLGRKFDFSVVTFTPNPDRAVCPHVVSISQAGGTLARQWRLFRVVWKKAREADTVFCQDPLVVGLTAGIAGKLLEKKLVIKFVGDPAWEAAYGAGRTKKFLDDFLAAPDSGLKSRLDIFLTRLSFTLANVIITPSRYLGTVVSRFYFQPESKIEVIHNAFEIPQKSSRKTAHHRAYTVITPLGRLVTWKKVDQVIEAVRKINTAGKIKVTLQVVGDGPERKTLEKLAGGLSVEFLGQTSREKGIELLKKADLFVLNSVYEGLPHTVLEAFAVGTPVVATDIPGTNEVAINNKTALTVSPGDVPGLATAVITALTNKDKTAVLITNGQNLLRKRFSWSQSFFQLEEIFRS